MLTASIEHRQFEVGDIVRHFKHELLSDEERKLDPNMYMYRIIAFATHTETLESLVIYTSLSNGSDTYARPLRLFVSEVDHRKYPSIRQKYRLEKIEKE